MDNRKISIVIPTYNRYQLTLDSFMDVVHDDRIFNISILDDCSTDGSYERLMQVLPHISDKIDLLQQPENKGVYLNKVAALTLCETDYCILLDSDNHIDKSYIDAIYSIPEWREDTIYAPEFARPYFDYRAFAGMTINRSNVAELYSRKQFDCLLNTMNYFLHADTFYANMDEDAVNPKAADSIYMNYIWLSHGNKIHVVPGMQYDHLVHDGSNYKAQAKESGAIMADIVSKIKALR